MIEKKIGNTPLRRCEHLSNKFSTNIYIKDESCNPGKSSKDRAAYFMLEEAIKGNKIQPGGTIVEASSGNTGISIALMAKELGCRAKIFVSKSCSEEKRALLEAYGASIEICDNSFGLHVFNSTQYQAQAYAANHENAYFTNQYYNSANIKAHYKTTGPEIWEQTNHQVTHVIAGVGTGGTISGIGRYLKEQKKNIKILGVEPTNSVYQTFLEHGKVENTGVVHDAIEGIGRTFIPGTFDAQAVDEIYQIDAESSKRAARDYRADTGQLIGFSSAAVLAAVEQNLSQMNFRHEDHVVLCFPDHGDRYLQKLYNNNQQETTKAFDIL